MSWYDQKLIHPRWKIEKPSKPILHTGGAIVRSKTIPAKLIPTSSAQKRNKAMGVCKKICEIMATSSKDDFGIRFKVLSDLLKHWCQGDEVCVSLKPSGQDDVCNSGNN